MSFLTADLTFALRLLRRSPVFTLVAALVIALGTGAVTTTFSALHALVLRPLPGTRDGSQLVSFEMVTTGDQRQMTTTRSIVDRVAERSRTLAMISGWNRSDLRVQVAEGTVSVTGGLTTGNFFEVLGTRAALGRVFQVSDDATATERPAVVLSHGFWMRHFAGDPAIVGRPLTINGSAFTVLGVTPAEFLGAMPIVPEDLYIPFAAERLVHGPRVDGNPVYVRPIARLRDGATLREAEREVSAVVASMAGDAAERPEDRRWSAVRLAMVRAVPEDARGPFQGFLSLLVAAAALVLLIGCVNVAAMLAARGMSRTRELAVRTALGARRGRIVRQLLTETLLLFVLGTAGGVVIAGMTTTALEQMRLPFDRSPVLEISPDARVLAVAAGVALVTALIFGLGPALRATATDVAGRLRDESAGGGRRTRGTQVLIAGQLAACVVLLVAAGLFVRTLDAARRIHPGFEAGGVTTAALNPQLWGYDSTRSDAFFARLERDVLRVPGTTGAAYTWIAPMTVSGTQGRVILDGRVAPADPGQPAGERVNLMQVSAAYFAVVRQPMRVGRAFADGDRTADVAIVNETFATKYWPRGEAIGRSFVAEGRRRTVIGVVADAKYNSLDEAAFPVVFYPIPPGSTMVRHILMRTTQSPAAAALELRRLIREIDPNVPMPAIATLERTTEVGLLPQRIGAFATGLMGGLGALMATAGLYGVIAYAVGRRTREIGVRIALGATRRDILRLIAGGGLRLTLIGTSVGLLTAALVTRFLARFLLVGALDLVAFTVVPAGLIVVALIASYVPARRAARTHPMHALRAE